MNMINYQMLSISKFIDPYKTNVTAYDIKSMQDLHNTLSKSF